MLYPGEYHIPCDNGAKNGLWDGEWRPSLKLLLGQSSLCRVVYKDNAAYHGEARPLFTDTASSAEEFEIYPPPTSKHVLVSGMITEAREESPADYMEPVKEIRRWFILTV